VAPYKDSRLIFDIATNLSSEYGIKFLDFDFKKKDGYAKTKELAKENGIYMQNYCGCVFSLLDKEQRTRGEV
jgi:predicted adenine nucleotide alpha hydrolase (AANH) superfamily ATPase